MDCSFSAEAPQCRYWIICCPTEFLTPQLLCDNDEDWAYPAAFYWCTLGQYAKLKARMEASRDFVPGKYTVGRSCVGLELKDDERVHIVDQELQDWIQDESAELGLKIVRWDLPYCAYGDVVGIDTILKAILEKVPHEENKRMVADDELGTIQLFCAFPDDFPLDKSYAAVLKHGKLHKFLDFLNFLIFGVEASRNNLVLLSGLLTLQRMCSGSIHEDDAGRHV